MRSRDVERLYSQYVLPTYRQTPICFVRGRLSRVWDIHGKEYLDFFPGWAVSGLGHCYPSVVYAIKQQANKLIHVPNNFLNLNQAKLAEALIKSSFPGKVFFCNSGTEAVEGAIKVARRFGHADGRFEIISMENSFHGRTFGAMTATGQSRIHEQFGPLPDGFRYAKFNDLASVERLVTDKTVAILLEPVQGEGGIHVATNAFLKGLRNLADARKLLLIFDEIQCGMGRTGTLFAFQHYGIAPDIMTLAKSLGNGVPIGALLVGEKFSGVMEPGSHGSTYGGNPLVTLAALAVLKAIDKERLLVKAAGMGGYLMNKMNDLKVAHAVVKEVRGLGLMCGMELSKPGKGVVSRCLDKGLLINCTQDTVLRIMPAMTVTKRQVDRAIQILDEALREEFS